MTRRLLLFCCWLWIHFSMKGQPITQATFDSIWALDAPLSVRLTQIDSLAIVLNPFDDELPQKQVRLALQMARKFKMSNLEDRLMLSLGSIYSTIDVQDSAKQYLHEALTRMESRKDRAQIARTYRELSWLYTYVPAYDKATQYAYQALNLYEALNDEKNAAILKSRIALILEETGQYEQVLPLLKEAEATLLQYQDFRVLGYVYLRLANYFEQIKDNVQAEEAYNNYLANMAKLPADKLSYLANAYSRRGRFHQSTQAYHKAEADLIRGRDLAKQMGTTLNYVVAQYKLGCFYANIGDEEKALPILENALKEITDQMAQDPGFFLAVDFKEMYQNFSQAYEELGMFEQAYSYLQKHNTFRDSIFSLEANRSMLDLQTKYETEKKEALLTARQQQLYLTISLLVILIVMAVSLFRANNSKRRKNDSLAKSNEEKAFLIKEIHHRVKNNLQVLSSILSLQSDYIADPAALDAVMEGRNRVQSMGLIHQKLYMGENLAAVDMKAYILDLTDHLLDSFGNISQVKVLVDVQIPPLDVDTAIPLGLIINELVTNSLKYAFREEQPGQVSIRLWIDGSKTLCLKVADNGLGKKAIVQPEASTSFGTDLVKILSKKLKGKIQTNTEEGYCTTIYFQRYAFK